MKLLKRNEGPNIPVEQKTAVGSASITEKVQVSISMHLSMFWEEKESASIFIAFE